MFLDAFVKRKKLAFCQEKACAKAWCAKPAGNLPSNAYANAWCANSDCFPLLSCSGDYATNVPPGNE